MSDKTPKWLKTNTADAAPPAPPAVSPADSSVSYSTSIGRGIVVSGRLPRKDAHAMLVPMPLDLMSRVDAAMLGGATSGGLVGLIVYALDRLEQENQMISIKLPVK